MEKLRHLLLGINCSSFASLQLEVHKIQKVFLEGLHNFFLITNVIHNVATCNITAAFTVYTWPPAHHCLPWQHRHSLTLTRPLPSLLLAVSLQLKHQGVPHIIKASLASYSRLLVIRIMKYFLFKYFLSRYKMSDFKVFFPAFRFLPNSSTSSTLYERCHASNRKPLCTWTKLSNMS